MNSKVRTFESGATRDLDVEKYDFDGFLSPLVLDAYAAYMHKHRYLPDGSLRAADNWKEGIPLDVYVKSEWRHHIDFWKLHHGLPAREGMEDTLCALLFNISGYLHEYLKTGAGRTAYVVDADRLAGIDFEALLEVSPGAVMHVPAGDVLRASSFGGITAHVPPFVDDEEPGSLKAGEAYREPESYGGSA